MNSLNNSKVSSDGP